MCNVYKNDLKIKLLMVVAAGGVQCSGDWAACLHSRDPWLCTPDAVRMLILPWPGWW